MRSTTAPRWPGAAAMVALAACGPATQQPGANMDWPQQLAFEFARVPDTLPTKWRGLIAEYGEDSTFRWYVLERERRLWVLDHRGNYVPMAEVSDTLFDAPLSTAAISGPVRFERDDTGRATAISVGTVTLPRRRIEPPSGANQLRVTPRRPVDELRREARLATPPAGNGSLRAPDLVDITRMDSTIRLDIRYATANNFLGAPVYEASRALLQRPAAEALVRANRALRPLRYTLLVHDAYRPWYVTRIFWDAMPDSLRWMVADPSQGSRHNRGAAVDVTLHDLEAGRPVEMPSTYDEATTRARAEYPGGTSLQRYHRALLRRVLQHEGFVVNPLEWWHFDHRDWRSYPILNVPFDSIPAR